MLHHVVHPRNTLDNFDGVRSQSSNTIILYEDLDGGSQIISKRILLLLIVLLLFTRLSCRHFSQRSQEPTLTPSPPQSPSNIVADIVYDEEILSTLATHSTTTTSSTTTATTAKDPQEEEEEDVDGSIETRLTFITSNI